MVKKHFFPLDLLEDVISGIRGVIVTSPKQFHVFLFNISMSYDEAPRFATKYIYNIRIS